MRTNRHPMDYNRRPKALTPAGLDWLNRHQAWTDELYQWYRWGFCTKAEFRTMIDKGIGWEDYRPGAVQLDRAAIAAGRD
jgi:hypothetical protein